MPEPRFNADQMRERTRERADQMRERTRERADQVRESTREQVDRARMTVQRLFGLDRSGPPPSETLPGAPLNVWTVPNAIGLLRLAAIPVFLWLALGRDQGVSTGTAILFFAIAGSDYLDGFAARVLGQYSRFGTLLDPLTDRALILAGGIVAWKFELLPRVLLAALVLREIYVLVQGRRAQQEGLPITVNWWGRLAVWPTMGGLFLALLGTQRPALISVTVGLVMSVVAAIIYTREAQQLRRLNRGTG